MPNTGYVPFTHHLVRAVGGASFPATKQQLIAYAGEQRVETKPGRQMRLADLLGYLVPETFPCATALYCALAAVMEKYDL